MALVQTPKMTDKNLAAHRQNGRQSRGASTPQGKERARAANLRHGYYSKINDQALTALGEDPQALAALIDGAHEQWRPANPHQAWITERLARLHEHRPIPRDNRLWTGDSATGASEATPPTLLAAGGAHR